MKAVIFDLDNTLVDFMGFKQKAVKAAAGEMARAGLEGNADEIAEGIIDAYWESGDLENPTIFQDYLMSTIGKIDYKYVAAGMIGYRRVELTDLNPYDGALETLRKLKKRGIIIGILSDAPALKAWFRLIHLGLQNEFDFVLTRTDTGVKKPDKRAFEAAIGGVKGLLVERHKGSSKKPEGIRPEDMLMVGDSYERDYAGAKKAGMSALVAEYGNLEKLPRELPEKDRLKNIRELIKKLENDD